MDLQLQTGVAYSWICSFPAGMWEELGTDGEALSQEPGGLPCPSTPKIALPSERLQDWPLTWLLTFFFLFLFPY